MATRFSNALQMSNSTDALFQAWVQFIHDTLITTGGWVDPGDTGQMVIASAAHPTLTSTKVGYRIYRMSDALQSASPVFLRIDYGSGGSSSNEPSIWLTLGTGSNGAGTITAAVLSNLQVRPAQNNATAGNSYGSADGGRLQLMLFINVGQLFLSLERSKDSTGADTGDGIMIAYSDGTGNIGALARTQYVVRAGGGQPPNETGVSTLLSNQTTSAFSSNVGFGLVVFYKGVAQVGLGIAVVNSGDFLAEASLSVSLFGSTRTYQLCSASGSNLYVPTGNSASTLRGNTRVGIRYD